jgi:hypothetical protein
LQKTYLYEKNLLAVPAGSNLASLVIRRNQANLTELHNFTPAEKKPLTDRDRLNPLKIELGVLMKSVARELAMSPKDKLAFDQLIEKRTLIGGMISEQEKNQMDKIFSQEVMDHIQEKINLKVKEFDLNQKIIAKSENHAAFASYKKKANKE